MTSTAKDKQGMKSIILLIEFSHYQGRHQTVSSTNIHSSSNMFQTTSKTLETRNLDIQPNSLKKTTANLHSCSSYNLTGACTDLVLNKSHRQPLTSPLQRHSATSKKLLNYLPIALIHVINHSSAWIVKKHGITAIITRYLFTSLLCHDLLFSGSQRTCSLGRAWSSSSPSLPSF